MRHSGLPGKTGIGLWRVDLHPESPRPLPESWPRPATTPIKASKLVRKPRSARLFTALLTLAATLTCYKKQTTWDTLL